MQDYYKVLYFCVEYANKTGDTLTVTDLTDNEREEFPPGYEIVDER